MKNQRYKAVITFMFVIVFISLFASVANATGTAPTGAANTQFNEVVKFLAGWIGKLGLVVGFIGAIQTGFAFRNDDADQKTKGMRTAISGFVVYAITLSLNLFGIT